MHDLSKEVRQLLIDAARSRRRLAVSMLEAYEADALPSPPTEEDLALWRDEVIDCNAELAKLKASDDN